MDRLLNNEHLSQPSTTETIVADREKELIEVINTTPEDDEIPDWIQYIQNINQKEREKESDFKKNEDNEDQEKSYNQKKKKTNRKLQKQQTRKEINEIFLS